MAFTDPITIAIDGSTDPSFTRTGMSPNGSTWVDSTSITGVRRELTIKHQPVGKVAPNGAQKWRHLIQLKHLQFNEDIGRDDEMIVNFTVTLPTTSVITDAHQDNLVQSLTVWIETSGVLAALLRREV